MISPRFLFVHGWGTDSYVWNGIAKEISGGSECRKIDMPGHGGTGKWDTDTLAPALREIKTVTGNTEHGYIIGVGWSLGAMALLSAAAKKPGLFKALVLIGAGASFINREGFEHGQPGGRVTVMIDGMSSSPEETIKKFYPLNFTASEMELPPVKEFIKRYSPPGPIECTEPGGNRPPGCYPKFDYAGITNALCALYGIDLRGSLAAVRAPALIIHGTKDTVCPVEAGRNLHTLLKNSKIEEFADSGHAPFLTERQRFIGSVQKFLKEINEDAG